jgi:hypothetical protein
MTIQSDPSKAPILNLILSNATGTGPGNGFRPTGALATFQVEGTFSATVTIEVTLDSVNWVSSGLTFTAAGVGSINGYFAAFRANVTAFTSGTVTSVYSIA